MKYAMLFAVTTVLCAITAACTHEHVADNRSCPAARSSVPFPGLAARLNHIQLCRPEISCVGDRWAGLETREIAGYTLANWLYDGPSKTFTVAEQDALLAEARARAMASRPLAKPIREISYFTDFLPSTQGPAYFVGARVTYGICSG